MKKADLITLSQKELEQLIADSVRKALKELFSNVSFLAQQPPVGGVAMA